MRYFFYFLLFVSFIANAQENNSEQSRNVIVKSISVTKKTLTFADNEAKIYKELSKYSSQFDSINSIEDSLKRIKSEIKTYNFSTYQENTYRETINEDFIYFRINDKKHELKISRLIEKKYRKEYSFPGNNKNIAIEVMLRYSQKLSKCEALIIHEAYTPDKWYFHRFSLLSLGKLTSTKIDKEYLNGEISKISIDELEKKTKSLLGIDRRYYQLVAIQKINDEKLNNLYSKYKLDLVGLTYLGNIKNEKSEGFGILLNQYGDTVYVGYWENGKPNGNGVIFANDYSGCHGNCENGYGKYIWANDGSSWEGVWKDGKRNGSGISINSDNITIGKWENDKREGEAKVYFPGSGLLNINEYKNGEKLRTITAENLPSSCLDGNCINGFGTKGYCNNFVLVKTNWINGKETEGIKFSKFVNECFYLGGINFNGKRHGFGIMIYPQGSIYAGNWIDGDKRWGGTEIWNNGTQFQGSFLGNEFVEGKKIFSSGEIWDGKWVKGEFTGRGKKTSKNGDVTEGIFEKGNLIKSIEEIQKEEKIIEDAKRKSEENRLAAAQRLTGSCSYSFSKPKGLKYEIIDDRKACCWGTCGNLARYKINDYENLEEIAYLSELLQMHFKEIRQGENIMYVDLLEAHEKADRDRLVDFISKNYPMGSAFAGSLLIGMGSVATFADAFNSALSGQKMRMPGSKERRVNPYDLKSKFCSNGCETLCRNNGCKCN